MKTLQEARTARKTIIIAEPAADPLAPLVHSLAAQLAPLLVDGMAARTAPPPAYVDEQTTASHFSTSVATIRAHVAEGMPCIYLGDRRRFSLVQCAEYLAARGPRGAK